MIPWVDGREELPLHALAYLWPQVFGLRPDRQATSRGGREADLSRGPNQPADPRVVSHPLYFFAWFVGGVSAAVAV